MAEIDFGEYLSESERKEIVEHEFRTAIRESLRTRASAERILSNLAYYVVEDLVDEAVEDLGKTGRELIAENTVKVIQGLSTYSVFRDDNLMGRKSPSKAQEILNEVAQESRPLIEEKVKAIIDTVGVNEVRYQLQEVIERLFYDPKETNQND